MEAIVRTSENTGQHRWQQWLWVNGLWVILLLALVLRLIAINSREIQYDDAFSILLAQRSLAEIVSGTSADTMPPLYYFLLHFWLFLGRSVWWLRLLSVLLNMATIVLFYQVVCSLFGRMPAYGAALLMAVSPLHIYHAQDIRMYALVLVCQMGYLWFFIRIWQSRSAGWGQRGNWIGLVLCGIGAMYSHNLAIFGLGIPNLFLLLRREWKLLFRLVAAQLVTLLFFLPWLVYLPGQLQKIERAFWTPRPGLVEVIQAILLFTVNLPLPGVWLLVAAVISLQILVIIGIEVRKSAQNRAGLLFVLVWLFFPPVVLFILSYLMRPVFVTRGFLLASLGYYALGGLVIANGWQRGIGKILAGSFVLAALASLFFYYTFDTFPRSPYRQALAYLNEAGRTEGRIIHENKLSYFPSYFYDPDLPQSFLADLPGSSNDTFALESQRAMAIFPQPDLATAVGDSQDVYYVLFSQTIAEYQALGLEQHPDLAWLDDHFRRVERVAFNDLEIHHYQR